MPLIRRAAWTFGSTALVCVAAGGAYACAWVTTIDTKLAVAVVVSHVVAECARIVTDPYTVSVIRRAQRERKCCGLLCRPWAGSAGEDVSTVVASVRPLATQIVATSNEEVDLNTALRTTMAPGAAAPERRPAAQEASMGVLDMSAAPRMGP
ncbi:hypothetical protein AMAG_19562 [Allomyces macrogynus ATCC 38327]|uniref:Uncharacterized protein n=1 Tax=Allomyces macrogynus (strain ATCC 38327) TaxID=578462 RepID=A0A0L0SWX5_ALLM3|nr:hypothetical protein AMAG_19562 [Allomyces macrogynus ATCC 38327]|eukprot:KNE66997.1 hypothetical protein AMAG_19562 [Allomyces macrogynus ATCC 38327]